VSIRLSLVPVLRICAAVRLPRPPPCVCKVRDSVAFTLIIDILEDGWQNDESENGLIMAFPE
jgi:hypothetical protein